MNFNLVTNIANCYYDIPVLLYYSHIPSAAVMFLIGFFVFIKNKKSLSANILFFVTIFFSLWIVSNIIIWTSPDSRMVMFFWSLINIFEISISLLTLYFAYVFLESKDVSWKLKVSALLLISPLIVLSSTKFNLTGFDTTICEAGQGPLLYYFYFFESVVFLSLLSYLIKKIVKPAQGNRKLTVLFSLGTLLFILSFSGTNIIASLTQSWDILMYGLISAPLFVGILAYIIVQFHTFNIKLLATQALVWGLVILIGSQFFFIRNPVNYFLNGFTFVASIIFGYFLIKSVKREVKQREELAKLNLSLKELIKQRENLVHLVTHKVKGSFTRSKYIFAGMLDGTFGDIPPEIKKRAEQGLESNDAGINTVDLVLNVANMQNGIVKYDMKPLDFKDIVLKTIAEKKVQAEAKGLAMESSIHDSPNDKYNVMGDVFWLKEAVANLVDNSIKYTKQGKISIDLHDGNGKITFSVKDTGIGITDEDKKNLFTEGGRGKDSVRINVDSTGYGLYSVKLIIEAHKGRVWVESEVGKGSTFFIELDAAV